MKQKERMYTIFSELDIDYETEKDIYDEGIEEGWISKGYDFYEYVNDMMYDQYRELRNALDHDCNIIAVGSLGLWNGRYDTWGRRYNLNEILTSQCNGDVYTETWIDESDEVWHVDSHHDGRNMYNFRLFKRDLTEEEIDDYFLWLDHKPTEKEVEKLTEPLGRLVLEKLREGGLY